MDKAHFQCYRPGRQLIKYLAIIVSTYSQCKSYYYNTHRNGLQARLQVRISWHVTFRDDLRFLDIQMVLISQSESRLRLFNGIRFQLESTNLLEGAFVPTDPESQFFLLRIHDRSFERDQWAIHIMQQNRHRLPASLTRHALADDRNPVTFCGIPKS